MAADNDNGNGNVGAIDDDGIVYVDGNECEKSVAWYDVVGGKIIGVDLILYDGNAWR